MKNFFSFYFFFSILFLFVKATPFPSSFPLPDNSSVIIVQHEPPARFALKLGNQDSNGNFNVLFYNNTQVSIPLSNLTSIERVRLPDGSTLYPNYTTYLNTSPLYTNNNKQFQRDEPIIAYPNGLVLFPFKFPTFALPNNSSSLFDINTGNVYINCANSFLFRIPKPNSLLFDLPLPISSLSTSPIIPFNLSDNSGLIYGGSVFNGVDDVGLSIFFDLFSFNSYFDVYSYETQKLGYIIENGQLDACVSTTYDEGGKLLILCNNGRFQVQDLNLPNPVKFDKPYLSNFQFYKFNFITKLFETTNGSVIYPNNIIHSPIDDPSGYHDYDGQPLPFFT
jgi:hypothetical protein